MRVDVDKRLQQLNILSFDDLITRLADALQKDSSKALSMEIQARYQAALIDEFQDTDKNQWFIFSTLFSHDTLANLELLRILLVKAGYSVRGAINGQTAIMACKTKPPEFTEYLRQTWAKVMFSSGF